MEESRRDPKEVEAEAVVNEYISYVKADEDNIGLLGNQPNLVNIRVAYKSNLINEEDLHSIVAALVNKYEGKAQPFESIKSFFNHLRPNLVPATKELDLTREQSTNIIKGLLAIHDPKKAKDIAKKFKAKHRKKAKAKIKIDASALPDKFKHLARSV